jgi:hypothetical protein
MKTARRSLCAVLIIAFATPTSAGLLVKEVTENINKAAEGISSGQNGDKSSAPGGSSGKDCGALGAGCANGMEPLMQCMAKAEGYFWKLTADQLEKNMQQATALTPEQRQAWEADIASAREAHVNNARRITPADPQDPDRYLKRLTDDQQVAIGTEASAFIQATRNDCNAKYSRF